MTAKEYRDRGYEVSMQIEQAVIDRAEREITEAYIKPLTDKGVEDADVKEAVFALAYLRMTQQRFFATRSGGKTKTNEFGQDYDQWAKVAEWGAVCDMWLSKVAKANGKRTDVVTDICRIYFKSNWLGM